MPKRQHKACTTVFTKHKQELWLDNMDELPGLQLTLCLLFATIDQYSNSLNPDQMPSNLASDLDPSFLTARQKVQV